jgi:2-polyprenyl-6-methoxyphenol hydroxylase-like FAD-dependent oxidoreductase
MAEHPLDVVIVGAGIGGLTLGLRLHQAGIPCRIYEAAPEIKPLGVGINLLPHASKELTELGLQDALAEVAITTTKIAYYNRFGQLIYNDPSGRYGGYDWPMFSIHRGDLQMVLLAAFVERVGGDRLVTNHRCTRVEQNSEGAVAHFEHSVTKQQLTSQRGSVAIACDGMHSVIRKQFFPDEGPPRYSGINMWRGVTRWKPFLDGATFVRIGWHKPAKVLIYPIRNNIDGEGRQLINWVCDIEQETPIAQRDWNRQGKLEDFIGAIEDWRFPWLDVPAMCRAADQILEYPMVDQDPLPRWSHGRVTLLGDAAHPMQPRGANGGAQAILDCTALARCLAAATNPVQALAAYEAERRPATTKVVLTNREQPPDAVLQEVYRRTGDMPFRHIDDVISQAELSGLLNRYQRIAGFDLEKLAAQR